MSDNPSTEVEEEVVELPAISGSAHASASLGVTIIVNGKSAWPKFEFGDNALPGETAEELIERVNDLTIEGAYNVAEKARWLMTELTTNKKEA